jgi:uncharacterized protein (DUF934 family)
MALIKDGKPLPDPWRPLADDEPLPESGPVVVSLARFRAERETLAGRGQPLGIRLKSAESPALIAGDLGLFGLVALEFPKFTDGRAYSYARLLRERYRFRGELRAVGNVLRDQLLFMHRCGFDAFEIASDRAAEWWRDAVAEITLAYQPAADARAPMSAARGRAAEGPAAATRERHA